MEIRDSARSSSSSLAPGDDGGGGRWIRVGVHLFRVWVHRCPCAWREIRVAVVAPPNRKEVASRDLTGRRRGKRVAIAARMGGRTTGGGGGGGTEGGRRQASPAPVMQWEVAWGGARGDGGWVWSELGLGLERGELYR